MPGGLLAVKSATSLASNQEQVRTSWCNLFPAGPAGSLSLSLPAEPRCAVGLNLDTATPWVMPANLPEEPLPEARRSLQKPSPFLRLLSTPPSVGGIRSPEIRVTSDAPPPPTSLSLFPGSSQGGCSSFFSCLLQHLPV